MVYIIIIILHKEREKKIGSAIWIIFISLSRYCFWLHKVSEDRMLGRLKKMMLVIVITERSGASQTRRLPGLLKGDLSLKTEGE